VAHQSDKGKSWSGRGLPIDQHFLFKMSLPHRTGWTAERTCRALLAGRLEINGGSKGSVLHPEVDLVQQISASYAWLTASGANDEVVNGYWMPWVVKRVSRVAETARTGKGRYMVPSSVALIEERNDAKRVF
jgi:hypothetical protein